MTQAKIVGEIRRSTISPKTKRWKIGVKKPLKQRQIWAIRFFLDRERRMRDGALFDLAIDSKLRGGDLVKIKIGTLVMSQEIRTRAMVIQQKTARPVQLEITAEARARARPLNKESGLGFLGF